MQVAQMYRAKMHYAVDQAVQGNWPIFVSTMVQAAIDAEKGQDLKAALLQVPMHREIITSTYGLNVLQGPYINGCIL